MMTFKQLVIAGSALWATSSSYSDDISLLGQQPGDQSSGAGLP
jgi:hypothetical protein